MLAGTAPFAPASPATGGPGPSRDTSYVCAVDRWGNVFSATPSDVSNDTPVIPGTGLCPSRSEEHTSELQSLMRISYAVFCLKKKNQLNNRHNNHKPSQSI